MIEKLKHWNEWWIENNVYKNKLGIKREGFLSEIFKMIKVKEISVLSGVRRSGKSTLVFQLIDLLIKEVNPKNILYFNFDETLEYKDNRALDLVYNTFLELNNPKGKKYVFFDEIQNIVGWEKWIKKNYDLYGSEIKFVLTGSNNSMLYDNLSKLLTGRILTKMVFPLAFKEFLTFNKFELKDIDIQKQEIKHYFLDYLNKGGFPEVVLETDDYINNLRLKEYYDGILLRDIVQPRNIREVSKIMDLSNYCMTNTSALISYNNISKITGLNITTLKEYLLFLESAYLIFQLKFFSYSLKESIAIQKPRKIYCIDNGLRNSVSFKFSKDDGKLAENLTFIELKRRNKEIYYWNGKREVDFIIKNKDQSLTAINVSYTNEIDEREIKGLEEFKAKFKSKVKRCILLTNSLSKKEKNIEFIPLWKYLLED
ncbi:MAG: ATP-binding protein [Nanoarchaeota archaeon]|nr:ATP-binding protein [Nanoarchaeota archaeon]